MVVCNNRSFYNDERHQGRMADQPRAARQRIAGSASSIDDPEWTSPAWRACRALHGIGPVTDPAKLQSAIEEGISVASSGKPCVIDARVLPGYDRPD